MVLEWEENQIELKKEHHLQEISNSFRYLILFSSYGVFRGLSLYKGY